MKGVLAKSSAEQVTKIVTIARELGVEPATADEARQILGLKRLAQVGFQPGAVGLPTGDLDYAMFSKSQLVTSNACLMG